MREKPLLKSLLKFAEENFSDKYYACLHGEIKKINVLALAIQRSRWTLKRPFAKSELIILEGLEKYVESHGAEEFRKELEKMITDEEEMEVKQLALGESATDAGGDVSRFFEVTVKLDEDYGDIRLGRLTQQYITDPDIRGLLEKTTLDNNKIGTFEDDLLLITSVIKSEKFEVTGERASEAEINATLGAPVCADLVFPEVRGHIRKKTIPPGVATRNTPGPLLFKCCKVTYNKETQRLEIPKGEYIGKTVVKIKNRDGQPAPKEEDHVECGDTLVKLGLDTTDSPDFFCTSEDFEKLETVEREVLIPEKNREQRKAKIRKYLGWIEKSLSSDQDKLTVEEPLTSEDCRFLRQAYLSCDEDSNMLDLRCLAKDEIQGYGIVLKRLDDLPDEKWSELEEKLYGPE